MPHHLQSLGDQSIPRLWRHLAHLRIHHLPYLLHQLDKLISEEDREAFSQNKAFCNYQEACGLLKEASSTTPDNMGSYYDQVITRFIDALAVFANNLNAYDDYYQVFMEAEDWISTMSTDSDAANRLGDYLRPAIRE